MKFLPPVALDPSATGGIRLSQNIQVSKAASHPIFPPIRPSMQVQRPVDLRQLGSALQGAIRKIFNDKKDVRGAVESEILRKY